MLKKQLRGHSKVTSNERTVTTLYHGSPHKFSKIKPKAHYLAGGENVVFATPLRAIAISSVRPWTDVDFEQGVVDEDPPYMIENYPGAFEDIYEGKSGYLYELSSETFYTTPALTRFEFVSDSSPKIFHIEYIEDALEALISSNMQLILYEDADAFIQNGYRTLY